MSDAPPTVASERRAAAGVAAAILCALAPAIALGQAGGAPDAGANAGAAEPSDAPDAGIDGDDGGEVIEISEQFPKGPRLPEERPGSQVLRDDLEHRLPRSSPDALRYEPGVFVQQTAHSQGSAFIRGLTGQQTLLMFDGVRLNNSTYRQGPNQYFFTLDSQTIDSIQIIRGGASTRYGSDALGGVVMAVPIEARTVDTDDVRVDPHLRLRAATADGERGGRAQTQLAVGRHVAFFGGAGGRRVGRLESGGVVRNPQDGEPPRVPRFESDGRTQLGTGFDELTADGRLQFRPNANRNLKIAAYAYRQFDAPRTDQCPAAFAPYDECLQYDEQFRTLVYGAWEERPETIALERLRATMSWQGQRERRTLNRPSSEVDNIGRDSVATFGASLTANTRELAPAHWLRARIDYGADTYHDRIASAAWIRFTDTGTVERRSRGQYLDGSHYTYGGAFAEAAARVPGGVALRLGGRVSWIDASAPADPDSGSSAVDERWFPIVGNAGVEWRATRAVRLLAGIDRSFRAPNLDDLTSRQQTGPGFQFENPALEPEKGTTIEVGARLAGRISAEAWVFRTTLDDAVIKSPREQIDCPPDTPRCEASWTRFQLVNADGQSEIRGVEASLFALLPLRLTARATAGWTWGEGPNVGEPPSDPSPSYPDRIPLSRIPPLNGTAELTWTHAAGLSAAVGLRWARAQTRLALADIADERIPQGGTPGFAVVDLRASYRHRDNLLVSVVLENLLDAAYRYHGSSVNGPGRGLVLLVDVAPIWR